MRVWWIPSVFGLTVGTVLFATVYLIPIKADDIWWHLKTGQIILARLQLPMKNMYSFTAEHNVWMPQEWLSQVVFYVVYHWLGYRGLIFSGILLNAAACGFVYKLIIRYSKSPYVSAVITFLASLMILGQFSIKPYLFGNLFFIITLYMMEHNRMGGRMRPFGLFLLFAGWANFHGSFLMGLALIVIYLFASLTVFLRNKETKLDVLKPYFMDFILAVAGSMATPNHVFGLIFPVAYLQNAFANEVTYLTNLSEWRPAGLETPLGQMVFFYLLFCVFAVAGSGKAPKTLHIGLLVAFSVFAFSSIRNIPLLGMVATLVLARHLPLAFRRTWKIMVRKRKLVDMLESIHQRLVVVDMRSKTLVLPALSVLILVIMFSLPKSYGLSYSALGDVHELADLSRDYYPKSLMEYLREKNSKHRIFNHFNWGGAMIWALYPQFRVFIDQRSNCYPTDVFLDYFAVHHLKKGWLDVLNKWNIDMVAYPVDTQLSKALKKTSGWWVEYEDSQVVLFTRSLY